MSFSLLSKTTELTPQFIVSCVSIGGPATTVTWSRGSDILNDITETTLENAITAEYTHTLTVTGGQEGVYMCSVANIISNDSAQLSVSGKLNHQ